MLSPPPPPPPFAYPTLLRSPAPLLHPLQPPAGHLLAAHLGAGQAVHPHHVGGEVVRALQQRGADPVGVHRHPRPLEGRDADRKSTRLNSSHLVISYAVFCLK